MQSRLAVVIASVDIGLGVDELLDHSLNRQASRENKWCRTVISFGVKICGAMSQQDLENSLGIGGNTGVERSSSSVIGSIGVRFSIQKLFSGVGPGITSSQVKGSFSSLVHLRIDLGTLSNQILDDSLRSFFITQILRNISAVKAATSEGSQHERGKAAWSSHIHIVDASLGAHHHVRLGRSERSEDVRVLDVCRIHVLLGPSSVIVAIISDHSLSGASIPFPLSLERLFCGVVIGPSVVVVPGMIHVVLLGSRKPVYGPEHFLSIWSPFLRSSYSSSSS